MDRRTLLKLLQSGLVGSAASLAFPPALLAADKKRDKRPVGLLVPLTGPQAQLGLSMRQAALLAETDGLMLDFDTGGTPAGAAAAAQAAVKRGCALILGPLGGEEVPAVAGAVGGRVPVVAFSNDVVRRAPGTFIFGITPAQVSSAILRYARGRGVRSVVVIDDGGPWSAAAAVAAGRLESDLGMSIRVLEVRSDQPLPNAGDAPDAVLLPGSGETVLAAARNLKDTGIQLLGTVQALDYRPASLEILDGAWLASPDPKLFGQFSSEFQARSGGRAGAITALAYDAAGIAGKLRDDNKLNLDGLLSNEGFHCVTGPVRFRTDGSVARDFAILRATKEGYDPVAVSSGA